MTRPADVGHLVLSFIPREPDKISTTRLRELLTQQGVERTPRAIQEKLQALAAEYPIRCLAKSKPFQWQWLKGAPSYEFPPMNAHTALTLKLAHAHLAALLPVASLSHLKTQMRRADEVLKQSSPVGSWNEKVRVFPRGLSLGAPLLDRAVLEVVYAALLEQRQFRTSYTRRGHAVAETMDVNPIALVVRGTLVTLVCTIGPEQRLRQLHLHRMKNASRLAAKAVVPDGFDLDRHIQEGHLSFRLARRKIRLRALFVPQIEATLEETPLTSDQRLSRRKDGRVMLSATVEDTLELRAWLSSYGPYVEVRAPDSLRRAMIDKVRATAALYGV